MGDNQHIRVCSMQPTQQGVVPNNGEMTKMVMVDINKYCVHLLFFLVRRVDSIRGGSAPYKVFFTF